MRDEYDDYDAIGYGDNDAYDEDEESSNYADTDNEEDLTEDDTLADENDVASMDTEEEAADEPDETARKYFADYDFKDIMKDYRSGNEKQQMYAKECAVYALEGVVRSIIKKRYSSYTNKHFDDLDQCGKLGIIKAMEKYDEDKGAASTFFYSYIIHEMQMYIDSYVNKTTPHYSSNIRKIKRAITDMEVKKGTYTTVDIANATGLTMEAVEQALSILNSSNEVYYDNCTDAFLNENMNAFNMTPEEEYVEKEKDEALGKALKTLSKTERYVVILSAGLLDSKPLSHKEIAKKLHIPLDSVKKIYAESLRKLRNSELRKTYNDYIAHDEITARNGAIPLLDMDLAVDEADVLAKIVDVDF